MLVVIYTAKIVYICVLMNFFPHPTLLVTHLWFHGMYVCVCVCVCVYVCMYVCMYVCIYEVYVCMYIYACMYVCVCM